MQTGNGYLKSKEFKRDAIILGVLIILSMLLNFHKI